MRYTLFGKDTKGGFKEWSVEAIGDEVYISHGKHLGKMQIKVTKCSGKNVGRSNETSPNEQAILEAQAKYNKQLDKLYRPTFEELELVGNELPMLAHDFTKVGHRMTFPCYASAKLDGVRCIARITSGNVTMTSRGGKAYNVPDHIQDGLQRLLELLQVDKLVLDGELYIHGMPLQDIVSCVKKPNKNTTDLKFYIFDVPDDTPWSNRMLSLEMWVGAYLLDGYIPGLEVVPNMLVNNIEEARKLLYNFMEEGYEGLMLRDPDGLYEYNHRSSSLMKWKEFQEVEALVYDLEEDKLGEAVLLVRLPNGVSFKCKMRGTHDTRLYANQLSLVENWITVRFQQYTKDDVPQFPVGISTRVCDESGNPLE